MQEIVLAATGHRPHKLDNDYDLVTELTKRIMDRVRDVVKEKKPSKMISGMALGFDTMFALVAIELDLPLIAAIPCDNQDKMWPQKSKNLYHKILSYPKCEAKVICPGPYAGWKMLKRDCWMVDNCTDLLACWDGTDGGTGHTVKYAQEVVTPIIRINPDDIRQEIKNGRNKLV